MMKMEEFDGKIEQLFDSLLLGFMETLHVDSTSRPLTTLKLN